MKQEQQLEIYKQTITALNTENERLKKELSSALSQLQVMGQALNLPENGYKRAYLEMQEYCRMARESYQKAEEYRKEMKIMKAKYIKELQDTVNSLL